MKSVRWPKKEKGSSPKGVAIKIVLLAFLWIAGNVRLTDADLVDEEIVGGNKATATTLDLGTKNTVNNQPSTLFFQTVGLIAGGFDVKSLRIKNEGKEKFNYKVNFEKIGGSDEVCNQLYLTWWTRTATNKWQGQIDQINYQGAIPDEGWEDSIILIERKSQSGISGSCQFDLVFKTIRSNQAESGGLRDEERLTNFITVAN